MRHLEDKLNNSQIVHDKLDTVSRSQTADALSVTLCWQQTMENVRLVSDLFKQCLNDVLHCSTHLSDSRDVECTTGFIIRNISEDNLKHTALDVFNSFRLFFGKAGMPGWTGVFNKLVRDRGQRVRI